MAAESEKRIAAISAVELVKDGMDIGLGTGTTAEIAVQLLAEKVRQGLKIRGLPTSERTRALAESLAIPLITFEDVDSLDLDIDGADEIDPELQLIKGGGGALLREKIVASSAKSVIIIADHKKMVKRLGAFRLPVEIIPFGYSVVKKNVQALGARAALRLKGSEPYVTDQRNWIIDCDFGLIDHPRELARKLSAIPGVVEHGLFVDIATTVVVGQGESASVIHRRPPVPTATSQ